MFDLNSTASMLDRIVDYNYPDSKVMIALFIVFVALTYKTLKVLKNTVVIAIISASFPFVLNHFFAAGIHIDLNAVVFYAAAGALVYLVYEISKTLYQTSKVFIAVVNALLYPFVAVYRFISWLFSGSGKKKEKTKKESDKKKPDE